MPPQGTLYAHPPATRRQHGNREVYFMNDHKPERDLFWLDLPAGDEQTPERQNTEEDEYNRQLHNDLAGTVYARRAIAESPLAQTYAPDEDEDLDLGLYPEVTPPPQPWAMPDPPKGLPVLPPDGGLPPI